MDLLAKKVSMNTLGTAYLAAAKRTETIMHTAANKQERSSEPEEAWLSDDADALVYNVEQLRLGAMGCYVNGMMDLEDHEPQKLDPTPVKRRCCVEMRSEQRPLVRTERSHYDRAPSYISDLGNPGDSVTMADSPADGSAT
jgi:hypothetical protein